MDYRKAFQVKPGTKVKLDEFDPSYSGKHGSEKHAQADVERYLAELNKQQHLLYAEKNNALLIVLQAPDAGGKDGTIDHVMSAMNPQGTVVTGFKQPTAEELDHDFLWRVHRHAPAKGAVAIFNRSHYEDVLVARVHRLVPKSIWSERYEVINEFERLLRRQNNTHVIKLFLHISKQEQLARFKQRLDDPARNWKISESDYEERQLWDDYVKAYEDVFAETSTKHALWYIIPSNHKWFRNLAVSQIVADTLGDLRMKLPAPSVDLEAIRREYHQAAAADGGADANGKVKKKDKRYNVC